MKPATIPIPQTPQAVQETLQDGTMIQVTFFGGLDVSPAPEIIKVRRCPRREFVQYAEAVMGTMVDEEREAAFYVDKPIAWVQSLSEESFSDVMEEGRRLNFTRFQLWFKRRRDVIEMSGVTSKALEEAAAKIAKTSPSSTSS